jgi:hypothetical protein
MSPGLLAGGASGTLFAGDAARNLGPLEPPGAGARRTSRLVEGRSQASPVRDRATAVPNAPDADHGEGTNLQLGARETQRDPGAMISKFPSIEEIRVVVAGETAGRFSQSRFLE